MPITDNLEAVTRQHIPVSTLVDSWRGQFALSKANGDIGMANLIRESGLYRPQLALAGYTDFFTYHKVQVFGNTEVYYLKSLPPAKQREAFAGITSFDVPCIILTNNNSLDSELLDIATNNNVPVLRTELATTDTQRLLTELLDAQFAQRAMVHGSFVDVYGVGLLFLGRSGIGKSEIVLDLVERGHRLVADDAVLLTRKREDILIGAATGPAKHFMEIRGLGIIDIRQMFGMRAIRFQKRLEIVVELEEWNPAADYTRTGLDVNLTSVLDVDISFVKLPIFPGKNITVIAEVIALNYLLRVYGYNAAEEFSQKIDAEIRRKREKLPSRDQDVVFPYFDNDYE